MPQRGLIAHGRLPAMLVITAAVAAMLSLAGSAAGAAIPIKGPKTIRGAGFVTITLKGSTRSSVVLTSSGTKALSFIDKNGNLSVRCTGGAKRKQTKSPAAKKTITCTGKNPGAQAAGSNFTVRLYATTYQATIPKGYSGSYDLTQPRTDSKEAQAFKDCLKDHGVSIDDPSKMDPNDPKVQEALQACRKYLPSGAGSP